MDTPSDRIKRTVHRLRPSQRTLRLVAMCLFLVLSATIVVASVPNDYDNPDNFDVFEDFEDQTAPDFTNGEIITESFEDTYSLATGSGGSKVTTNQDITHNIEANWSSSDDELYFRAWTAGSQIELNNPADGTDDVLIRSGGSVSFRTDGSSTSTGDIGNWENQWTDFYVIYNSDDTIDIYKWNAGGTPPSNANISGSSSGWNTQEAELKLTETNNNEIRLDEVGGPSAVFNHTLSGQVLDQDNNELEDVTINVTNDDRQTTTNVNGEYSIGIDDGTYTIHANKSGYFNRSKDVTISGSDEMLDFKLEEKAGGLEITTHNFLEHGEVASYNVTATVINETSGEEERSDVTTQATVTSDNTSIVTVDDDFDFEIEATENVQVNAQTFVTATYTTSSGDTLTADENVTVANRTVDNLKILPPMTRLTASLNGGTDDNRNDRTILVLIIAASAAAALSIFATSLAGLGAMTAMMLGAWILGATNDGMIIVTVFTAMFIGMNVAGNVNYDVRK